MYVTTVIALMSVREPQPAFVAPVEELLYDTCVRHSMLPGIY
jgi:hypothetical protein